ncbi:MAG: hypothetical protein ACKO7B_11220, partial [Flavobacteriales bacterium]
MYHLISRLSFLLTICWTVVACNTSDEKSISGQLDHAGNIRIILSRVTSQGELALDSVMTDDNGRFSLRNAADRPDYYLLRTGNS